MRTHADDVLDQTVLLVRAIARTGTYAPAHPNYERARTRLHRDIERLLRVNPEIAFVPTPPMLEGAPAELHVDGASPSRTDIRRIIPETQGGAFALQLLQFLQQRGIIQLAFKKAFTLDELITFLDLVAADAGGVEIDETLIAMNMRNIVVVTDRDLPPDNMPWTARSVFGRFLHDAFAQNRMGGWGDDGKKIRGELISDAVRPFLRSPDAMVTVLAHAPLIQPLLRRSPELEGIQVRLLIMDNLPSGTVYLVVNSLTRQGLQMEDALRQELLGLAAVRLAREQASPQRDRILRDLCVRGAIGIKQLPPELREWVYAEQWVEAASSDPLTGPPASAGIALKAVSHAIANERYMVATIALRHLRKLDALAASSALDSSAVEVMALHISLEQPGFGDIVSLFEEADDSALFALAVVVAVMDAREAGPAAKVLAELGPRGATASRKALEAGVKSEAGALTLLSILSPHANTGAAPMLMKYTKHPAAPVRREALSLLAAADANKADAYVAQAFKDDDSSVRVRALTICASTGLGRAQIVPRAMDLIVKDAARADASVVCAAIDVVSRAAQQGALLTADAEKIFCKLVEPVGTVGRMLGREALPADVLAAGISALSTFSSPKAQRILDKLVRDKDPEISKIARKALAGRTARPE